MKHEEPFRFPEDPLVEDIVENLRVIDECKKEIFSLKNDYLERLKKLIICLESREDQVAEIRQEILKRGKRENRCPKGR